MTEPPDWASPGGRQPDDPSLGPASERPHPDYPPQPSYPPPIPGWGAPLDIKPGVIPLRPLGLGEILDGAISYIRANPMATLGLSAAIMVVVELIQLPVTLSLGNDLSALTDPSVDPDAVLGALASVSTSTLVAAVVSFLATTVLTGMLIVVLSQAVLGKHMSIGQAWSAARGRLLGLVGVSLLNLLAILLVFAVAAVPGVIAAVAGAPSVVTGLLFVLGTLAALVVSIYLWVTWAMIGPVYVLEHAGLLAAFTRSRALSRHDWWRIFGILLLALVIALVIASIISFPFTLVAGGTAAFSATATAAAPLTPLGLVIAAIGSILANTLVAPFQAGVTGLVYFDQRIRREALDITLLRATGR